MPAKEDMPSTLRRSPEKAQETWAKTHDSAVQTYGEGERAHRTAFSALKHSYEKVGDHWEPKDRKGPSDAQAARSGAVLAAVPPDRRRGRRERVQGTPHGPGQAARRARTVPDEQGRAGRGDRQGERPGERAVASRLVHAA